MLDLLGIFASGAEGRVRRAAFLGRKISFVYYSPNNREVTERGVKVVRVWKENGKTYFTGECGLRGEERTFRLDRVVRFTKSSNP